MTYLVVPASGDGTDLPVFETALVAARALGARLGFVHVRSDVLTVVAAMYATNVEGPVGLDGLTADLERDAQAREAACRQAVEAFCAGHSVSLTPADGSGVSADWTSVVGVEEDVLPSLARAGDATVMGRHAEIGDALAQVLLESGRPVLVAPASAPASLVDTVVVAWNDTAEAARAATAAAPFLAKAGAIVVMTVIDDPDDADAASAERLASALRSHGKPVRVAQVRRQGRPAAEALLDAAREAGASLIVMGGYSHSRLRELVFGGFTRDILDHAPLPVLIAH